MLEQQLGNIVRCAGLATVALALFSVKPAFAVIYLYNLTTGALTESSDFTAANNAPICDFKGEFIGFSDSGGVERHWILGGLGLAGFIGNNTLDAQAINGFVGGDFAGTSPDDLVPEDFVGTGNAVSGSGPPRLGLRGASGNSTYILDTSLGVGVWRTVAIDNPTL